MPTDLVFYFSFLASVAAISINFGQKTLFVARLQRTLDLTDDTKNHAVSGELPVWGVE